MFSKNTLCFTEIISLCIVVSNNLLDILKYTSKVET